MFTRTGNAKGIDSETCAQRGYRLFAPVYDRVFGQSLHHGRKAAIEALECEPGERILELCIGSGLSLELYPSDVVLVGADLSRDMLLLAARRLRQSRPEGSRSLVQMDAERLAFADGSFDKAVVLFGVAGLPDAVRAMQELRRVCRPGARIVIASRFRSGPKWLRVFDLLLAPLYRFIAYRSDLDPSALLAKSGLDLIDMRPVNLLGYSSVLVCRSP